MRQAKTPMHAGGTQTAMRAAVRECGIHLRITPHSLRHYLPFLTISSDVAEHRKLFVNSEGYAQSRIRLPYIVFPARDY